MWRYSQVTGGWRAQYVLHNEPKDYFDAAHIQVTNNHGYGQIEIAMPAPKGSKERISYPKLTPDEVKLLQPCNKDIQSAKIWFKEIYHYLRHQKQAFKFTRMLGTAWRHCDYKGFKLLCGRRLEEPLTDGGWKYETASVLVIGKDDWFCNCREDQYKYVVHLSQEPGECADVVPQCPWWQKKDSGALRMKADLAGTR